jgi:hypothetical protein
MNLAKHLPAIVADPSPIEQVISLGSPSHETASFRCELSRMLLGAFAGHSFQPLNVRANQVMELLETIDVPRHLQRTDGDASDKPPKNSKLFCTHFAIENLRGVGITTVSRTPFSLV